MKPLLTCLVIASAALGAQQAESWLGSLAPVARAIQRERGFPLAFEQRGSLAVEEWRRRARAELEHALAYFPEPVPLDLKVHAVERREGLEIRTISFAGSAHYRIPAFVLVPTSGQPPFPGVVALHDHGGWFYHGKEKLVRTEAEHPALAAFRERYYGGRAWAEELARRGFVVIVPDAFYWGSGGSGTGNFPRRSPSAWPGSIPAVRSMSAPGIHFCASRPPCSRPGSASPAPPGWELSRTTTAAPWKPWPRSAKWMPGGSAVRDCPGEATGALT